MIEWEKKILLCEDEFVCLRQAFKVIRVHHYVNYYYDTENLDMFLHATTCRVREKDGDYIATMKCHSSEQTGYSQETSEAVRDLDSIELFDGLKVMPYGCLKTERSFFYDRPGLQVVLDRNDYLDQTDYEIEIEYSPDCVLQVYQVLLRLADTLSQEKEGFCYRDFLNRIGKGKSKSDRFFRRYLELAKP